MTRNDVLKDLQKYKEILEAKVDLNVSVNAKTALSKVTKAIEELQQYQAIGTVERLLQLQHDYWYLNEMCKEYSAIGTVEDIRFLVENIGSIKLLKEYNAIGTVEEFKALKENQEQGLLLRLPCKVGDIFYCIAGEHVKRIHEMKVLDVNPFGAIYEEDEIIKIYNMYLNGNIGYLHCSFSEIGKTVFLTKEEAEQALEKMEKMSEYDER